MPYDVSSLGRVRNARSGRILSPSSHRKGYKQVVLCVSGKKYGRRIHRLVCEAWHGPSHGRHACHVNGDPADNRPCNLRWGTPAENERDKIRHGTRGLGEDAPNSKLNRADVEEIVDICQRGGITHREVARRFGVCRSTITRIANGYRRG